MNQNRSFARHFPAPMHPMVAAFGPDEVVAWAEGLGEPVFTGSSARVFPRSMKGSPLLRRWLARLERAEIRTRWRWQGWSGEDLSFATPQGPQMVRAKAVILTLGGGSWPRLGSDAAWVPWLTARGIPVAPFQPANMGFDTDWSDHFITRFAGAPVKSCALTIGAHSLRGEFVVTRTGVEGSAVYALSAPLREACAGGDAVLTLDLFPDQTEAAIAAKLSRPRKGQSRANHWRKTLGLTGVRSALLRELAADRMDDPGETAKALKSLPLPILRPRPLAEAISSAGGIPWSALTPDLMLAELQGVFCAGEMLDWEAPTGGYLLTGCFATGRWAGRAAARSVAGPGSLPKRGE